MQSREFVSALLEEPVHPMALLNFAHREITAKVVWIGPSKAGCNANLRSLHEVLSRPEHASTPSRVHQFAPPGVDERTTYFELVDTPFQQPELAIRLRLYSLPGGLDDAEHRAAVMEGVDGVVLVLDSRPGAMPHNEEALLALEELVEGQGLDLASLPVVLQVNHLDHAEARDVAAVVRDLNPYGFPVIGASAREGTGILETFDTIRDITRTRLEEHLAGGRSGLALTALHDGKHHTDEDVVRAHLERYASLERLAQTEVSNATPSTPSAPVPVDEISVAYQPRRLANFRPSEATAAIDEDGAYVDLTLERLNGSEPTLLRVRLQNRPADSEPVAPKPSFSLASDDSPEVMGVTDHLPDRISLNGQPAKARDLPPVVYGVVGFFGGLLVCALLVLAIG